ncbi:hypothetical protein GS461_09845 [Rhodococcus hoagii]|nr:hypothetical protein [Prescottella equi]
MSTEALLAVLIAIAVANTLVSVLVLFAVKGVRVRLAIARSQAAETNVHLQSQQRLVAEQEHLLRAALPPRRHSTQKDPR